MIYILHISLTLLAISHITNLMRNLAVDLTLYHLASAEIKNLIPVLRVRNIVTSLNQGSAMWIVSVSAKAIADAICEAYQVDHASRTAVTFVITASADGGYVLFARYMRGFSLKKFKVELAFPAGASLLLSPFAGLLSPLPWFVLGKAIRNVGFGVKESLVFHEDFTDANKTPEERVRAYLKTM